MISCLYLCISFNHYFIDFKFLLIDSYEQQPTSTIKQNSVEPRPEDAIPDTVENSAAREFLAKAPTKGLWMPLGKEVKVMKCWRCKIYGHRSGDKECPMFMSGNQKAEQFRHSHEDPMYNYVKESEMRQKVEKVEMLKKLLQEISPSSSPSSSKSKSKKKKRKNSKKSGKCSKRRREDSSNSENSSSPTTSTSKSSSSQSTLSSSSSSSSSEDDKRQKRKSKHKKTKSHRHKLKKRKHKH